MTNAGGDRAFRCPIGFSAFRLRFTFLHLVFMGSWLLFIVLYLDRG